MVFRYRRSRCRPATTSPNWRATNWDSHRIENVTLAAGPNNTIELSTNAWYVAVDEILVATAADLARAQPHRRVRSLPQVEQEQLLAFLRQLDGTPAPAEVDAVFADGFEP